MDTRATAVPLLDRLLEPLSQCIQGEGERALLDLRVDPILHEAAALQFLQPSKARVVTPGDSAAG